MRRHRGPLKVNCTRVSSSQIPPGSQLGIHTGKQQESTPKEIISLWVKFSLCQGSRSVYFSMTQLLSFSSFLLYFPQEGGRSQWHSDPSFLDKLMHIKTRDSEFTGLVHQIVSARMVCRKKTLSFLAFLAYPHYILQ